MPPVSQPMPASVETVTIANCGVGGQETPDGGFRLAFVLPTGRQYVFPLSKEGREAVRNLMGGVAIYGPDAIPGSNGLIRP